MRNMFVFLAIVMIAAGVWAPATTFAQDDEECEPVVTLTSEGVELSGCDDDQLLETAEVMFEESDPTVSDLEDGQWAIRWFEGATRQMRGRGNNPWPQFEDVAPALWSEFPNVENPEADFDSADGLEYGMDESDYMQNDIGDVLVPSRHYRLITGDYNLGFDQCEADDESFQGCALMLINVGEVTSNFENVTVNNAFTVWGRYWNGDTLPIAITALMSHAGNNMLNLGSTLNPDGITNAGANCSSPDGCERVRLTFVIISGNEVLAIGRTYVSR